MGGMLATEEQAFKEGGYIVAAQRDISVSRLAVGLIVIVDG